jgi:hypothetical protein
VADGFGRVFCPNTPVWRSCSIRPSADGRGRRVAFEGTARSNEIPVLGWKWVVRTSLKSRIKLRNKYYSDEGRPNAKHN